MPVWKANSGTWMEQKIKEQETPEKDTEMG